MSSATTTSQSALIDHAGPKDVEFIPASILIVDDEPNIRLMVRTILEGDGHQIREAADGRAALAAIAAEHTDIVLLDLSMPTWGGMAVLEELHLNPMADRPKVIVLTAFGSITVAVKAVRLGASDFLSKPATPADVRLSISAVLAEARTDKADHHFTGHPTLGSTAYGEVLSAVRRDLSRRDYHHAERLLTEVADCAGRDPAYFNLLGVLHEAENDLRSARTFYRKAASTGYGPAKHNLLRLHELDLYGRTPLDVELGDEGKLLGGSFKGRVGSSHLDLVRRTLEQP